MTSVQLIYLSLTVTFCLGSTVIPKGYTPDDLHQKAYKIMYLAQNWNGAQQKCAKEGAKLAVPKTKDEFLFLQQMIRGIHYKDIVGSKFKLLLWVGINNLEDYTVWKNVDGENFNDTDFHVWAGDNGQDPRPDPKEPHCVGMDPHNYGFREYWCHLHQAYICEKKIE